jgi:nicotinamidase-related amidase
MSNSFTYTRLSKDDAVCLLVDHQSGLISLVQDFSPGEFKNNVLALAASAKYFRLPTILTTSFENGPNGPLVPELRALFPDAPYIARPGQHQCLGQRGVRRGGARDRDASSSSSPGS